ncbi:unnamed protein product [Anisakis simplex]|uniref:Transmembrane protein n=1 Tax=Anisakis simplex TaxID=6269 RepID=A0A0M3JEF1_ANISI|nr:unnamed protein product [Anisakis simplex]
MPFVNVHDVIRRPPSQEDVHIEEQAPPSVRTTPSRGTYPEMTTAHTPPPSIFEGEQRHATIDTLLKPGILAGMFYVHVFFSMFRHLQTAFVVSSFMHFIFSKNVCLTTSHHQFHFLYYQFEYMMLTLLIMSSSFAHSMKFATNCCTAGSVLLNCMDLISA